MKDETIARVLITQAQMVAGLDYKVLEAGLYPSKESLYLQGFGDGLTMAEFDREVGSAVFEHLHREAMLGQDLDADVREMIRTLREEL